MKEDIKQKLIGYKPSHVYVDDYTSDYVDQQDNIDTNTELEDLEEGKEQIENLLEDLNELDSIIGAMPNDFSNAIKEVFDQVLDFSKEELSDKILHPVPEVDEWEYVDLETKPDKDKEETNNDSMWDTDDFFPIEKEEHTEEEVYEKEYIKNLVDLLEDYKTNLHNITSNFWTNFLLASTNKTSSEIKLLLDNILLSSSNIKSDAKHLLDTAVRENINKTVKFNFYNLMFNAEETIKHLKQLKAMQELRLRYSRIDEIKGDTKTNQMNNNVLIASKLTYDKKYETAYENLYRYLNSSNTILQDTLASFIQEIKTKQILIERQGII